MKLQAETVRQINNELKELTNVFTRWGQSLYEGVLPKEQDSIYEKASCNAHNHTHDNFSLYEFTRKLLEKHGGAR